MPCYSPVNSVLRSLEVLKVLNRQRVSTVDQIHKVTGLPKPTIVRLLETLILAGLVAKEDWDKGYRVTSGVNALSCGFHGGPLAVEAGRPWALELTRIHRWPAGIAVPDGNAVMISYTSSSESAMTPYHAIIHKRLGLITKALGRAYLAFCPEEEREMTMRLLQTSEHPDSHMMSASGAIEQLIETTRQLGFAERVTAAIPEASSSVAVPIYEHGTGKVLATIGLTYYASAVGRKQILQQYVPHLHTAAAAISDNIAKMNTTLAEERQAEPVRLAG